MSAKKKLFAIFQTAKETNQELNLAKLSIVLDTPEPKLKTWLAELKMSDTREAVQAEAGPELFINDHGVIEVVESRKTSIVDLRDFRDGVAGLTLLHTEVQATAGTLITKIADMAEEDLSPKDLVSLTSALTSVQQAFFNRPVTNIQVNNAGEGSGLLTAFRDRLQA